MSALPIAVRPPLFFMHIPKTAGTSLRMFLDNQYAAHHILPATNWHEAVAQAAHGPRQLRLARGHFPYNFRAALPRFQALTLLREPIARTLSALRHLARDPAFHALHGLARTLTLPELLRNETIMAAQTNVQTAYLSATAPPDAVAAYLRQNPQADPIALESDPNLPRALESLAAIEFVGLVESLPACLTALSTALCFHHTGDLPHINAAPPAAEAPLTEEDQAILRHHNDLDLQLYAKAPAIIEQQNFIRMMRHLVRSGVYNIPQDSFTIDLAGTVPGANWYAPERDGDSLWRWTGANPTLELVLRQDAAYQVCLEMIAYLAPGLPQVEVNGHPIPAEFCPLSNTSTACELRFEIPQPVSAQNEGFCRITVRAAATRPPGDDRPLAFAVSAISFAQQG